jgi:ABC-2 type transport system ATP-binding protein
VHHIDPFTNPELGMSIHGAVHSTNSPRATGPGAGALAEIAQGARVTIADGPTTPPTPAARKPSVISARGLVKSYRAGVAGCTGTVAAIRGVDLDVGIGEALGVLGPPGAGKSTLLLCLAGLLRPDAGTIAWFDRPADEAGRPPGIVYVPDRAAHYAFMTVREAVEYHVMLRDVAGDAPGSAIDVALEEAGLAPVASSRVGDVPWSIGPRLSLAQALVGSPRVLLLDETLTGLDPRSRREIAAMLRTLVDRGTTVIAAAETLDTLDDLVTRVAVMLAGEMTGPLDYAALQRPRALELTVATPAVARRIFGARVAEASWDRHVLTMPLEGTTPEAILARCRASGLRVERSRVVARTDDNSTPRTEEADARHR